MEMSIYYFIVIGVENNNVSNKLGKSTWTMCPADRIKPLININRLLYINYGKEVNHMGHVSNM